MKNKIGIYFFAFTISFNNTHAQSVNDHFPMVASVVFSSQSAKNLQISLDSLGGLYIPSRSKFSIVVKRDIDFSFWHERFNLQLNFDNFQVDILTRNDTIFAKTVRQYLKPFEINSTTFQFDSSYSIAVVQEYLLKRNAFYKSHKTPDDLITEISEYHVFAFHCGDGLPETEEGKMIKSLVADGNLNKLTLLLQSICVETQAFAISGIHLLQKNGYFIPALIRKNIKHVKKRNSKTIICSGCISGLVERLYNK